MIPTKNDNNKNRQGNKERKQMDTQQRYRHADRRETDRQAGKQADRQVGRQAGRDRELELKNFILQGL